MNEVDRSAAVELRHLTALRAVAAARSFSDAAAVLGYTQSAVSHQIASLERIVGQRLVERPGGPRPVSLTEAGQLMLDPPATRPAVLDRLAQRTCRPAGVLGRS
jgi:molybdenum-dependent DNA-binding transcriptional regulator ModE